MNEHEPVLNVRGDEIGRVWTLKGYTVYVVNRKGKEAYEYTLYVGRPCSLGNPVKSPPVARETAIEQYRDWLTARLAEPLSSQSRCFARLVRHLRARYRVSLACWCAPLPCHADVIAQFLLERTLSDG